MTWNLKFYNVLLLNYNKEQCDITTKFGVLYVFLSHDTFPTKISHQDGVVFEIIEKYFLGYICTPIN